MDALSLANLGWHAYFQQQLSLEEWEVAIPVRVIAAHRSQLDATGDLGLISIPLATDMPAITVGDWLLLKQGRFQRLLDRSSVFTRKAPGRKAQEQLLAANVDTAFIVCSLNDDFNLNRIERYLTLCHDAGAEPVVVLTKQDLCMDADEKRQQIQQLDPLLCVETVNGLDPDSAAQLQPWCRAGQTIVLLGSSGAGKSTLTNTLLNKQEQVTGGIREADDKGRHTTTGRTLLSMAGGALLIDTPGLRELQLAVDDEAIAATFSDITKLADHCRFSDCQHNNEPGCAVLKALECGDLDERRYRSFVKLSREQSRNQASLAERHKADRALGKFYKRTLADGHRLKGR
ncbi:ribosome small subunit-dependent GTPase A [Gilvimarinus sp. SDUM040013]|uniref:Small ribosomal subunit biogenesis GTPase RsgA n=1 Tax=Gilvimarinus gilvus TaxID=3058038 RepID=A0ABU4S2R8_9GAMM|nr:ribosome small subunit-dependent GTPase A [Gilvimarinus sp. SDUM040013]MDO3384395.1 ribosome small subunit-dependent GTPase A [Gilvimarinus sp. SDUM040013]MDX6851446.1 ribosome small subunit-dependent GTPase A [Gilvimarinus sp. SDUM040013]